MSKNAGLFSLTSTLHGVLQGSEALWTLVEATALVQVKARVALRAEVFAETGFTVIYPTPCERNNRENVTQDSGQDLLIWSRLKGR